MKYTDKLKLQLPENGEFYNLEVFNANSVLIDKAFNEIDVDANDILNKIKTVDGTGSGLDADLLDGKDSTAFATSDHKHEMSDINNLNLTAENTTVKDTDNNFTSGTVEGALMELATKDKALDKRIDDNKTEVDEKFEEIKQSGSDFKDSVASAITAKGVSTSGTDNKQTFVNNIGSIDTKTPIEPDELGVIEWKDGTHRGFKEITNSKIITPITERKKISYFKTSPQYHQGFYVNVYVMDQEYNLFCSGYARYAVNSRVSKVDRDNKLYWQYQFNDTIERIILDNNKNIIVLAGSKTFSSRAITKLSNDGKLIWTKQFLDIDLKDITVDKNGYVYALSGVLETNQNTMIYKLDPSDGNIVKTKNYGVIERGYKIDYNSELNIIVFATNNSIYKIDTELEIFLKKFAFVNAAWADLKLTDSGNLFISVTYSVSLYDKDLNLIWSYSSVGGSIAINDLEECYMNSNYDMVKLNNLGEVEFVLELRDAKEPFFIKDNIVAFSYGASGDYREMALLQDNFKVTENVLLKTNYIQL